MNVVNVTRHHYTNKELYKYKSQHGASNSNIRHHIGGNKGKKGSKQVNKKILLRNILSC